ncbi:MAG: ATP-binding protein, partial [Planctomycetota bacterium]|nr:ATP-binding protein [Planctomycetota bacterium]
SLSNPIAGSRPGLRFCQSDGMGGFAAFAGRWLLPEMAFGWIPMRNLPAIVAGSVRLVLPMADSSADALIDTLLAADNSSQAELASALALDPPLLLWTAHHATTDLADESMTVADLADWLLENGPAVFDWGEAPEKAFHISATEAQSGQGVDLEPSAWAERVAEAVEMGELARRASAADRAQQAYLAGVLRVAGQWFPQVPLPPTLEQLPLEKLSVEKLSAKQLPAKDKAARDAGRHARSRWLEPSTSAARLPALARRLARLRQLEERFDETLLAEKLEAMAEFAAGAGHEINNPVAVIAGRAQLFLQGETDPERRRALALINAQAKRVYEMITDMMLFARPPAAAHSAVELVAIIDRVIDELKPATSERAISLSRSGEASPIEIEADPEQLNVALRAICRNSLEAIGHDGNIEIDVQLDGKLDGQLGGPDRVLIQISDDGPGISDDARSHVFDPFYSARQAGRGLGLGLSKCWRIVVTNHGGRIEVDSGPGRPTVFTITLPMIQSHDTDHREDG